MSVSFILSLRGDIFMKTQYAKAISLLKSGDLVGGVIALSIAVIVTVGVGIPITQQVIADGNLSGITATVVSFIPVFLALAILLGAVQVMRGTV